MKRQFERIDCPVCGRRVAAYVPYMGDGTDVKIVPHTSAFQRGRPCPASGLMECEILRSEAGFARTT